MSKETKHKLAPQPQTHKLASNCKQPKSELKDMSIASKTKSAVSWPDQLEDIVGSIDYCSEIEQLLLSQEPNHESNNKSDTTTTTLVDAWGESTLVGNSAQVTLQQTSTPRIAEPCITDTPQNNNQSSRKNDEEPHSVIRTAVFPPSPSESEMDDVRAVVGQIMDDTQAMARSIMDTKSHCVGLLEQETQSHRWKLNTNERLACVENMITHLGNIVQESLDRTEAKSNAQSTSAAPQETQFHTNINIKINTLNQELERAKKLATDAMTAVNRLEDERELDTHQADPTIIRPRTAEPTASTTAYAPQRKQERAWVKRLHGALASEIDVRLSKQSERVAMVERDLAWKLCEQAKDLDMKVSECQKLVLDNRSREMRGLALEQRLKGDLARAENFANQMSSRVVAIERRIAFAENTIGDVAEAAEDQANALVRATSTHSKSEEELLNERCSEMQQVAERAFRMFQKDMQHDPQSPLVVKLQLRLDTLERELNEALMNGFLNTQTYVAECEAESKSDVNEEDPLMAYVSRKEAEELTRQVANDLIENDVKTLLKNQEERHKASVDELVKQEVDMQLRKQVAEQVKIELEGPVKQQLLKEFEEKVKMQVETQVKEQVAEQVRAQVDVQVKQQVKEQLDQQLNVVMSAKVNELVNNLWQERVESFNNDAKKGVDEQTVPPEWFEDFKHEVENLRIEQQTTIQELTAQIAEVKLLCKAKNDTTQVEESSNSNMINKLASISKVQTDLKQHIDEIAQQCGDMKESWKVLADRMDAGCSKTHLESVQVELKSVERKCAEDRRKIRLQIEDLDDTVFQLERTVSVQSRVDNEVSQAKERMAAKAVPRTNSQTSTAPQPVMSPTKSSRSSLTSSIGYGHSNARNDVMGSNSGLHVGTDVGIETTRTIGSPGPIHHSASASRILTDDQRLKEEKRQEELAKVRKRLEEFEKKWKASQLNPQLKWPGTGKPPPPPNPPTAVQRAAAAAAASSSATTISGGSSRTGTGHVEQTSIRTETLTPDDMHAQASTSENEMNGRGVENGDESEDECDVEKEEDAKSGNETVETSESCHEDDDDDEEEEEEVEDGNDDERVEDDNDDDDERVEEKKQQQQQQKQDEEKQQQREQENKEEQEEQQQQKQERQQHEQGDRVSTSADEADNADESNDDEHANNTDHTINERNNDEASDNQPDQQDVVSVSNSNEVNKASKTGNQSAERVSERENDSADDSSKEVSTPRQTGPVKKMVPVVNSTVACTFCRRVLPGKQTVLMHEKVCNARPIECRHCGANIASGSIRRHELSCGQRSSVLICKFCDEHFESAPLLRTHEGTCDWEPSNCSHCNMVIIARDLAKHEERCATKNKTVLAEEKGDEGSSANNDEEDVNDSEGSASEEGNDTEPTSSGEDSDESYSQDENDNDENNQGSMSDDYDEFEESNDEDSEHSQYGNDSATSSTQNHVKHEPSSNQSESLQEDQRKIFEEEEEEEEESVREWNVEQVCRWLWVTLKIPRFVVKKFRDMDVGGENVLQLTDTDLVRQFDIQDNRLRRRILDGVVALRKRA